MGGDLGRGGCIQVKEKEGSSCWRTALPPHVEQGPKRGLEGKPALNIQTTKLEDWRYYSFFHFMQTLLIFG